MRIRSIIIAGVALLATATPAQAIEPQTLLDHSSNWIAAEGFDVGRAPLSLYNSFEASIKAWGGSDVPAASSGREGIAFYYPYSDDLRSLADRYGIRGKLNGRQVNAAQTVLHELLHRMGQKDWYRFDRREKRVIGQPMYYWDEAVTEAVALDLLPKYTAKLFGHRVHPRNVDRTGSTFYAERMKIIRQLSRFATGSPNYRHPRAIHWRSDLLHASYPLRAKMIGDAYQIRIEWGKGRAFSNPAPKLLPLR